jgi:23S rRNA (adenine2030-N6)-methyltransferase
MNYRHAYHAGNFADCLKHTALVAVLLHLRKKQTPFAVIDTHGGRGLYDIGGAEAKKTGEAEAGVLRLLARDDLTGVLAAYRDLLRGFGDGRYPGSPLIAAKLLRAKDRLVAIEKHPEEYAALAGVLAQDKRARVVEGDGYRELARFVPPPERRGLVLIDPPYEREDEFEAATRAAIAAHSRFATGIYLFWYPGKQEAKVAACAGELLNAGVTSLLRLELDTGAQHAPRDDGRGPPLTSAGLLVANPPFGFAAEMGAAIATLEALLAQGPGARGMLETIAER